MCDGVNDCGLDDDSDEKSCELYHKCPKSQFQCESDQNCIAEHFRCDGTPHCDDASDEIGCSEPICHFGACSQVCLEKKSGNYNCRCEEGYAKGFSKSDSCLANDDPLLLIASEREVRFVLPRKPLNTDVHGRMTVSKSKIDHFDVRISTDAVDLFWITKPIRSIQKLTTNAFTSQYKHKARRSTDDQTKTGGTNPTKTIVSLYFFSLL